jgi:PTH1 family peptidyl-tRNA hydrolase
MKLLVGLGNIGKKYEKTRHNIGFVCVDELANQYQLEEWKEEKKFHGMVSFGHIGNEKVILLKPSTYMNISGKSVSAVARFYKILPNDIWVFFDDVDLPFGTVRFREKGQSGGHNGIKSIIQSIGSAEFPRIKMGIANEYRSKMDTADFVLGKFTAEETKTVPSLVKEGLTIFLAQQS